MIRVKLRFAGVGTFDIFSHVQVQAARPGGTRTDIVTGRAK